MSLLTAPTKKSMPTALTIAGSDPCSGAGLQRDLKAFTDLGVYGLSVLTLLTAQNSAGVTAIEPIPTSFIAKQLAGLQRDFSIAATKISIVYNHANIQVLLEAIAQNNLGWLVIDPILSASSGYSFFIESDFASLFSLLTQAALVTPNIPEAALLSGRSQQEVIAQPEAIIKQLHQLGIKNILLKGGHAQPDGNRVVSDYFSDSQKIYALPHKHIKSDAYPEAGFHGTGCVLSSAIAAYLAHGFTLLDAVKQAQVYLLKSMENAIRLGKGALLI